MVGLLDSAWIFTLEYSCKQLDGYIARRFKGQSSMLGSVLDPLADKVLMSILCVSLTTGSLLPDERVYIQCCTDDYWHTCTHIHWWWVNSAIDSCDLGQRCSTHY